MSSTHDSPTTHDDGSPTRFPLRTRPDRPEGVQLCRNNETTGRVDRFSCVVAYAGVKDDEHVWRVVTDRWMRQGDWLEVDYLPPSAIVTGPDGATVGSDGRSDRRG